MMMYIRPAIRNGKLQYYVYCHNGQVLTVENTRLQAMAYIDEITNQEAIITVMPINNVFEVSEVLRKTDPEMQS